MNLTIFLPFFFIPYDYYLLAIQKWCSSEYMIHGLWPQYNNGNYPYNCKNVVYHTPHDNLLEEMYENWNTCDDPEDLWKHEWEKHGSCISQMYGYTEIDYYNKTLELFKKYKNDSDKICDNNSNCILKCLDLNFEEIDCIQS